MGEGGRPPAGENGDDAPADSMMEKLTQILNQFEITIAEANDLLVLTDYEMVVIADDSGSMQMSAVPPEARTLGAAVPSRWDELKFTLGLLVELGGCFDESGLDIHFLNRPKLTEVKSASSPLLLEAFANKPLGTTPLTECLRDVVKQCAEKCAAVEKPVLMFILTDGE